MGTAVSAAREQPYALHTDEFDMRLRKVTSNVEYINELSAWLELHACSLSVSMMMVPSLTLFETHHFFFHS